MADKKESWLYRREMKRQKEGLRARFREGFQAGREQSKAERAKTVEKNYEEMVRIYERIDGSCVSILSAVRAEED